MRILITRLSHIGDCVLTLPLAAALRAQVPDVWIGWAIEPAGHRLLGDQPGIDHFEVVPRGWLKRPRAIWELRQRLRGLHLDATLDPQSLLKSAALGWLSGAPRRVGMGGAYGRELSPWLNTMRVVPQRRHLVDRSLELLTGLGLQPVGPVPQLRPNPACVETMQRWLAERADDGRFVVLNPGASWPSKRWVLERYAEVARYCFDAWGLPTVVTWGGREEQGWAEAIVAAGGPGCHLAPATTLPELAALLSVARLFVGSDSGPMHMAAAVGCRCVALFGPTRPEESGPYGSDHSTVQAWYQAGSARARRSAPNLALQDVEVPTVCEAIDRQLRSGD